MGGGGGWVEGESRKGMEAIENKEEDEEKCSSCLSM